jgi:predicted O-methyltransferase YrrM
MKDELCTDLKELFETLSIEYDVTVGSRGVDVLCKTHGASLSMNNFVPLNERVFVPDDQGWMSDKEMHVLYETAYTVPAELGFALEIGCWKGRSTSAFALAGPVICIDHFRGSEEHTKNGPVDTFPTFVKNMESVGLMPNCIIMRESSDDALPKLSGTKVRIALIDGGHDTGQVARDLDSVWNLLAPEGFMFVDDYNWPTVRAAVDLFTVSHRDDVTFKDLTGKLAWIVRHKD